MLTQVKRVVLVAVAVAGLNLVGLNRGYANDPALQFASNFLQGLAIGLNGGGGGMPPGPGFVPGPGPGFIPGPGPGFMPGPAPGFPPTPPNPVVFDSGLTPGAVTFDPFGRPTVNTNQTIANASAMDPNRGVVDPGSLHASSTFATDSLGNEIEIVTNSWTSFGVPHSDTFRRLRNSAPGGGGFTQLNQLNQYEAKSTRPMSRQPVPNRVPYGVSRYGRR